MLNGLKCLCLIILFKITLQRLFTFFHSKPPLSSAYSFSSEIWLKVTGSHRPFKTLFDATWCPCQRIKGTVLIKSCFFFLQLLWPGECCGDYINIHFQFNTRALLGFYATDKRLWKWPHCGCFQCSYTVSHNQPIIVLTVNLWFVVIDYDVTINDLLIPFKLLIKLLMKDKICFKEF